MAPAAIQLSSPKSPLPECSPNLMPFHIAYSGPAPISTYFRVKPAPSRTPGTPPVTENIAESSRPQVLSQEQGVFVDGESMGAEAMSSNRPVASEGELVSLVEEGTAASESRTPNFSGTKDTDQHSELMSLSKEHPPDAAARFIAAFRGRTVHGLKVDLPPKYIGFTLQGQEEGPRGVQEGEAKQKKGKTRSKAVPNGGGGRVTRTASRLQDGAEMEVDDPSHPIIEVEGGVEDIDKRALKPTSTFSSFMLWHPDIPVDEGKDEYLRSLTEWTQLAAEIHGIEDSP